MSKLGVCKWCGIVVAMGSEADNSSNQEDYEAHRGKQDIHRVACSTCTTERTCDDCAAQFAKRGTGRWSERRPARYFHLTAGQDPEQAIRSVEDRGHAVLATVLLAADSVPVYGICEVAPPDVVKKKRQVGEKTIGRDGSR